MKKSKPLIVLCFSTNIFYGMYRIIVGKYSTEVRKFLLTMLELICEGIGIKTGYFEGELSKTQLVSVNHHTPCPDPSLTLGMPEHCDPNLISMLQQADVCGLQALKDGQWIGIEPLANAFVVIPGLQLRVSCRIYLHIYYSI